ncbi:MAG: CAP domain-containing protein [Anaerolineae bacterium]|nr:CAP domain-containing protein [Anaerolineae bacterium]
MRKLLTNLTFLLLLAAASSASLDAHAASPAAPAISPGAVISSINAYRAERGLYAYTTNSTLMAVAQGHSEYQASLGYFTHEGPGGTRPIDRVYASGYGDGQQIYVTEIVYAGTNATVNDAVTWWKGSSIHNDQMLATTYVDIGAGIASDGSSNYFTAVMAFVAGGSAPPGAGSGTGSTNPPGAAAVPVVVSTAQEDGTVIHIVQSGQTLWDIAIVYGVPLAEILKLNNLTENSLVYPGDEILIKKAEETATPTATASATATQTPSPTTTPKPTKASAVTQKPSEQSADTAREDESDGASPGSEDIGETFSNPAVRSIVLIAFGSIFLVLMASVFIQKKPEPPPKNDIF